MPVNPQRAVGKMHVHQLVPGLLYLFDDRHVQIERGVVHVDQHPEVFRAYILDHHEGVVKLVHDVGRSVCHRDTELKADGYVLFRCMVGYLLERFSGPVPRLAHVVLDDQRRPGHRLHNPCPPLVCQINALLHMLYGILSHGLDRRAQAPLVVPAERSDRRKLQVVLLQKFLDVLPILGRQVPRVAQRAVSVQIDSHIPQLRCFPDPVLHEMVEP